MNYQMLCKGTVLALLILTLTGLVARAGEDIASLSAAQIEARERQISRQVGKVMKAYRQEVEPLLVDLKTNCLRESNRNCFENVETLMQVTSLDELNTEIFSQWKAMFSLASSHQLLDRLHAKTLEAAKKVAGLEGQRPSRVAEQRWDVLVSGVNQMLAEADDILYGAGSSKSQITSQKHALGLIDALQSNEKTMGQAAKGMIAKLETAKADLAAFGKWAKNFTDYPRLAADGVKAVSGKITELSAVRGTDRSALYAHHRQFISGLPESLTTLSGLGQFAERVTEDRSANSAKWGWPSLSNIYTRWQNDSYDQIMAAGLRGRIDTAREARHAAKYQGGYDTWKGAAAAITNNEVRDLLHFWAKGALTPDRYAKDHELEPLLKAIQGEHERLHAKGLYLINPEDFLEPVKPTEEARDYHYGLIKDFNDSATIGAITAMKAKVEQGQREHPVHWSPELVRRYSAWQGHLFATYFKANLEEKARAAAALHMYRRHDPKPWRKACSAFDPAEVHSVVDLLQNGVIERASFEEPVRDAMIRNGDLTSAEAYGAVFWQEVLSATGSSAAGEKKGGFLNSILSAPADVLKGAGEALER